MLIKFLDRYDQWRPGDITRLEPTLMQRLIDVGRAEEYDPTPPKPEPEPKKKKPSRRKKKVERAVTIDKD